jgi:hypothetical protein
MIHTVTKLSVLCVFVRRFIEASAEFIGQSMAKHQSKHTIGAHNIFR